MMERGDKDHEEQEVGHVIRHYCKVCNKGFGCAGALGGHMRAHVVGDVCNNIIEDDNISHLKAEGNKHSYFLRAKTPRSTGYSDPEDGQEYKKPPLFSRLGTGKERLSPTPVALPGSKHEHVINENSPSREEEDLANCLVMLSNKSCHPKEEIKGKEVVERGVFQCKACKKVFSSHQALGGHRASHKKVKGCFAAKGEGNSLHDEENVDEDSNQEDHDHVAPSEPDATRSASTRKRPHKMHECSVCRRVFSSGQALGGHKRCHWLTTSADTAFIPNFHDFQYDHHQNQQQQQQFFKKPMLTANPNQKDRCDDYQLDLNLNLQQLAGSAGNVERDSSERGREVKLRKLSDLRDVNLDGGWLQMGIASTTDIC